MIGDAALRKVVRADLRRAVAGADLRSSACASARLPARTSRRSSRRERSTSMALSLFCSCDFWSCWLTTMPVGRCVMRTAESVVLTLCPPGPDERKTSMRRSLSSMRTSTSSASGSTATVAAEVWMRPWLSVAGTRCTRCTPDSQRSTPKAPSPCTLKTASLMPPSVPSDQRDRLDAPAAPLDVARVHAVAGRRRRGAASSPPVPARISTIAGRSSSGSRGMSSGSSAFSSAACSASRRSTSARASAANSGSSPSASSREPSSSWATRRRRPACSTTAARRRCSRPSSAKRDALLVTAGSASWLSTSSARASASARRSWRADRCTGEDTADEEKRDVHPRVTGVTAVQRPGGVLSTVTSDAPACPNVAASGASDHVAG